LTRSRVLRACEERGHVCSCRVRGCHDRPRVAPRPPPRLVCALPCSDARKVEATTMTRTTRTITTAAMLAAAGMLTMPETARAQTVFTTGASVVEWDVPDPR